MSAEAGKPQLGKLAQRLGLALTLVAAGVVVWRLLSLWPQIGSALQQTNVLLAITGLSLVYGGSLFLLAWTWALLIAPWRSATFRALVRAYGISAVAKYLPGNVFHLAGRQLVGSRLDISHKTMALATVFELALSVISALCVTAAFLIAADEPLDLGIGSSYILAAAVASAVLIAAILRIGAGRRKRQQPSGVNVPSPKASVIGFALATVFFVLSGLMAAVLYQAITGAGSLSLTIGAAYVAAWLTGYVVPGASGGLGVREAAMLVFLAPVIGEPMTLALAIAIRLVTTFGDLAFTGAAYLLIREEDSLSTNARSEKT